MGMTFVEISSFSLINLLGLNMVIAPSHRPIIKLPQYIAIKWELFASLILPKSDVFNKAPKFDGPFPEMKVIVKEEDKKQKRKEKSSPASPLPQHGTLRT